MEAEILRERSEDLDVVPLIGLPVHDAQGFHYNILAVNQHACERNDFQKSFNVHGGVNTSGITFKGAPANDSFESRCGDSLKRLELSLNVSMKPV